MEQSLLIEAKTVFANIINSLLLNESVYMPLLHLMIPADIGGRLMFFQKCGLTLMTKSNGNDGSNGRERKSKLDYLLNLTLRM